MAMGMDRAREAFGKLRVLQLSSEAKERAMKDTAWADVSFVLYCCSSTCPSAPVQIDINVLFLQHRVSEELLRSWLFHHI